MANCSKTEVFLSEWERMCDTVKICDDCDMRILVDGLKCTSKALCMLAVLRSKDATINIVQKWSDEHPAPKPKTYADDFFEKHPDARGYVSSGIRFPVVMWCHVYGECREHKTECSCTQRERCWNKPYKEEENG